MEQHRRHCLYLNGFKNVQSIKAGGSVSRANLSAYLPLVLKNARQKVHIPCLMWPPSLLVPGKVAVVLYL